MNNRTCTARTAFQTTGAEVRIRRRPKSAGFGMLALAAAALLATANTNLVAQIENPVYVDDSPSAWESFRRAMDQREDNPGEAVRLLQELLDESAYRLLPRTDVAQDQFTTIRSRVLDVLERDAALLERYRSMETARAERLLQAGRLEQLLRTRPLTQPGLTAMLRLAQHELELASFHNTLNLIEQVLRHPDLRDADEAHAWFLGGAAAHFTGDVERRDRATEALAQLRPRASNLRQRLDALIAQGDGPRAPIGASPLDRTFAADLSGIVGEPIWSIKLENSLFSRQHADVPSDRPMVVRRLEEARQGGYLMTAAPTIAEDVIYINEGHTVNAYDRFSGSPIWSRPFVDRTNLTIMDRDEHHAMDLSVIAVADGRLVTLTGHAYANTRSSDGRIICLDAETGRLEWSQRLDRLEGPGLREETSGIYPYGSPIIAEGTVFVLARRVSPQALASCYVFAFDLETGELLWSRHVVSSGSLRRSTRSYGSLVARDGALYLASPIGATARIEAATGEIRWLHRFPVPIMPPAAEQRRRPWEISTPAVTSQHVIAIMPDHRRIAVIDRERGDLFQIHDGRNRMTWNSPAYLLASDEHVFAVGEGVSAFRVGEYDEPVWTTERRRDGGEPSVDGSLLDEIRGRVHAAGEQLLVPTTSGLYIVAKETGIVEMVIGSQPGNASRDHDRMGPGNPVATRDGIAIAGNDRLDVFMSLSRAEQMLRERMAEKSDDPEPALALMKLAKRAGNIKLTLEAAYAARDAISRAPADVAAQAHETLFSLLLEAARETSQRQDVITSKGDSKLPTVNWQLSTAEALFDALGDVAKTPEQRVEYLLVRGDWMATETSKRRSLDPSMPRSLSAFDLWQDVLNDPELRAIKRAEDGIWRRADDWVVRRVARSDEVAESQKLPLDPSIPRSLDASDFAELLEVSERFPLSGAGREAAKRAADRFVAEDRFSDARAVLVRAMHIRNAAISVLDTEFADSALHSELSAQYAELLAHLIKLLLDGGRAGEAIDVLLAETSKHQNVKTSMPRSLNALNEALEDAAERGRVARVGLPSLQAEILEGVLLERVGDGSLADRLAPGGSHRVDYALFSRDGKIVRVDSAGLATRWQYGGHGELLRNVKLIRADDGDVLLWFTPEQAAEHEGAFAVMLDADDGTERWRAQPLNELIEPRQIGRTAGRLRDEMPGGARFDPDEVLPIVRHDDLVLVGRDGRVAALDLADGGTLRWAERTGLKRVHHAAVRDGVVALVGAREHGETAATLPVLAVIDLATGTMLSEQSGVRLPASGRGVKWMHLAPLGRLVYATETGLGAVDVFNQSLLWVNATDAAHQIDRVTAASDQRLAFVDDADRVRTIELESARISAPLDGPYRDEDSPAPIAQVIFDGDDLLVLYRQRLMRYDANGRIIGTDVVLDERQYRQLMRASDRLILLSEVPPSRQFAPGGIRREPERRTYRIYQLQGDGMLIESPSQLPPLPESVSRMALLDDWLVLSTQHGTVAVHMPAARE